MGGVKCGITCKHLIHNIYIDYNIVFVIIKYLKICINKEVLVI